MTWTYGGSPGSDTAAERRDAVRVLVGDTDTNDQQITDESITFFLSESNDDVYGAAANAARSIAASYARLVDSAFDGVRVSFSARKDQYLDLATRLERQASRRTGLGAPVVTGISLSEERSVDGDTDRPLPAFRDNQFDNPQNDYDDDRDYYYP